MVPSPVTTVSRVGHCFHRPPSLRADEPDLSQGGLTLMSIPCYWLLAWNHLYFQDTHPCIPQVLHIPGQRSCYVYVLTEFMASPSTILNVMMQNSQTLMLLPVCFDVFEEMIRVCVVSLKSFQQDSASTLFDMCFWFCSRQYA